MTSLPPPTPRPGRSFLERFGATILQGGIAPVPTTLYLYQAELGLSAQEVWFVGYILAHKWDEDLPYPSLVRMEEYTGMSRRNLLRIKDSLVAKGLLILVPRFNAEGGQASNAYDFAPLFARLEEFIRRDGPHAERRHTLVQREDEGVTSVSPSPVSPPPCDAGVTAPCDNTRGGCDASVTSPCDISVTPPVTISVGTVTSLSPPSVTRASQGTVTRTSHESESDQEEPNQEKSNQEEPPPTPTRHIPSAPSTPTVVVAVENQFDQDVRLLREHLGMAEETACECARLVQEHGRSRGYVAELVEHALTDREVRDPAKVVISNIRRNTRRAPTERSWFFGRRSRPPVLHLISSPPTEPPADTEELSALSDDPLPLLDDQPSPEMVQETARLWEEALITLRRALPPTAYQDTLRYLQLIEVDQKRGWALLTAPNLHLCKQVQTRLLAPIQAALRLAADATLRVVVVMASVHGTPTLAQLLAKGDPLLAGQAIPAEATSQPEQADSGSVETPLDDANPTMHDDALP